MQKLWETILKQIEKVTKTLEPAAQLIEFVNTMLRAGEEYILDKVLKNEKDQDEGEEN